MYDAQFIQSLFSLEGRTAIVTGAGSGIGWRIARFLARAGAAVVVADWNAQGANDVAAELTAAGHRALAVHVDVSDEAQVKRLFTTTVEKFGSPWILVNCAAIFPMEALADITMQSWDRVHGVDLRGVFMCLREAAALMRKAGDGGRIINISSLDAEHPAFAGLIHYGAAKAGVVGLTIHSALELARDRITVNAIMPGDTQTEGGAKARPIVPMEEVIAGAQRHAILGRSGLPEDIAGAVLYLASPAAAFVTGTWLKVDGGRDIT
ncbi:MAG: SDR family NAD(P)-dependent oxidoreductase [Gammaproteobacteria bacterium]